MKSTSNSLQRGWTEQIEIKFHVEDTDSSQRRGHSLLRKAYALQLLTGASDSQLRGSPAMPGEEGTFPEFKAKLVEAGTLPIANIKQVLEGKECTFRSISPALSHSPHGRSPLFFKAVGQHLKNEGLSPDTVVADAAELAP